MKHLKVFADQHHMSLYNSLRLLFEGRMGGELYRPIGEAWLERGYWRMAEIYNNHPATVAQYLGLMTNYHHDNAGLYSIEDTQHSSMQKAITLKRFFEEPIDIVIASIPQHVDSFSRLAADHPNKPKVIYQIGNQWNIAANSPIKNIMASTRLHAHPAGFNVIEYHQEFDLEVFKPRENLPGASAIDRTITSFINCFNTASIYTHDWALFTRIEQAMPQWTFKAYGGSCRDGNASGQYMLAQKMRDTRFIWHTKYEGDGYGHIIHNAAAIGRPAIVKRYYYLDKMAGELMIDGVTCVAIDGLSDQEIINKIEYFNQSDRYQALCHETYNNFYHLVNFNEEAKAISSFIENLI